MVELMSRQTDLRWFDPTHDFQVGETVICSSVNFRDREVTVAKVGRKLLHVQVSSWTETYRLDQEGGRPRNDAYQHESILTLEEVAYRKTVRETAASLEAVGIRVDVPRNWPVERLQAVLLAATTPFIFLPKETQS